MRVEAEVLSCALQLLRLAAEVWGRITVLRDTPSLPDRSLSVSMDSFRGVGRKRRLTFDEAVLGTVLDESDDVTDVKNVADEQHYPVTPAPFSLT